jgi:copper transport protein
MREQALPGGLHTAWRALAGGMANLGAVCLVALILSLAQALPAFAHASLVRAEPADGAVVAEPPASLKLTFNEPVSPLVMRIIGPDGEVIARQMSRLRTRSSPSPRRGYGKAPMC